MGSSWVGALDALWLIVLFLDSTILTEQKQSRYASRAQCASLGGVQRPP